MIDSGFCRKCLMHYRLAKEIDTRKEFAYCPVHRTKITLNHETLETLKQKLHLAKNEIGKELADVK